MTLLIIHIGTHKTGTTAIQRFLKANRSRLRSQGVGVLGLPSASRQLVNQLVSAPQDQLQRSRSNFSALIKDRMRREQERDQIRHSKYILSWEGFSGMGGHGYLDAPQIASLMAGLSPEMETQALVYYRRQDDFLESMYSQQVRRGLTSSFREYITSIPEGAYNWHQHVLAYQNHLGRENVIVSRYGRSFLPQRASLLHDFSAKAGLEVDALDFREPALLNKGNEGWSPEIVEIARQLNGLVSKEKMLAMRRILNAITTKDVYSPYTYMSPGERLQIIDRYRESNALLAADRFPESFEFLFPEDKGLTPDDAAIQAGNQGMDGIDSDTCIDIIRRIVECCDTNEWLLQQQKAKAEAAQESSSSWIHQLRRKLFRLTRSRS